MDLWASLEHELRYKADNHLSNEKIEQLRKYSKDLYEIDLGMQALYINKFVGSTEDD